MRLCRRRSRLQAEQAVNENASTNPEAPPQPVVEQASPVDAHGDSIMAPSTDDEVGRCPRTLSPPRCGLHTPSHSPPPIHSPAHAPTHPRTPFSLQDEYVSQDEDCCPYSSEYEDQDEDEDTKNTAGTATTAPTPTHPHPHNPSASVHNKDCIACAKGLIQAGRYDKAILKLTTAIKSCEDNDTLILLLTARAEAYSGLSRHLRTIPAEQSERRAVYAPDPHTLASSGLRDAENALRLEAGRACAVHVARGDALFLLERYHDARESYSLAQSYNFVPSVGLLNKIAECERALSGGEGGGEGGRAQHWRGRSGPCWALQPLRHSICCNQSASDGGCRMHTLPEIAV